MNSTRARASSKSATGCRASVWITGDQLLADHPALRMAEDLHGRDGIEVVMIETRARRKSRPYHRHKQVLVLSAMRHYAEDLRRRGYRVDYVRAASIADGLNSHLSRADRDGSYSLYMMAASEYAARQLQLVNIPSIFKECGGDPDRIKILPNLQFLTGHHNPYPAPGPQKRVVMENFYREMRRYFGVLLEPDGTPAGGKWNFDEENRKPLPAKVALPAADGWEPDQITREVMAEIAQEEGGTGVVDGFRWAVTHAQAREALRLFIATRLADFGPYEDAMTTRSATLFHSLLSPYLNLGLLEPLEVVRAAEEAYREGRAPINSVEGFIRQILGWREFIYWQYWQQMPGLTTANHWQARRSLPDFFWTGETSMNCLKQVVARVLADGYSHHIERLMIICNYCLLAGVDPREVSDWFNAVYIDAFDWVVLPNVIGMGLNADGGRTATKPYIASANYINRMSDYCKGCVYDPKQRTGQQACPFNKLYWNFLIGNEQKLRANPRLGPAVLGLNRVGEDERAVIIAEAAEVLKSGPQSSS
ncbi:MAG: cryptochrome/photolyase family protein [Acidobacteriota bacterium]